jgi:CRISPR-associated protein (TIGR03985 family)
MSEIVFNHPLSVTFLQSLAQGALKQNFLRAVRLWAWLVFFYGEESRSLPENFTYADCRQVFFQASHPQRDERPTCRPVDGCACTQTAAFYLFDTDETKTATKWCQRLQQQGQIEEKQLAAWLQQRPFAVTRRSLSGDLKILAALGWLEKTDLGYQRVTSPPDSWHDLEVENSARSRPLGLDRLHPDLAMIMQNLSLQTKVGPRFFLHLDYVVPNALADTVDDWQDQLREVWQLEPVPPIQLKYRSARYQKVIEQVVYPVCAYYVQRAVYLCGFNPELPHQWYNYRLDKIERFKQLDWSNSAVPESLRQLTWKDKLPTPEYVGEELVKAWGFDFYLPAQWLILRFERQFHDAYIAGTERHDTFAQIDYPDAIALIKTEAAKVELDALLTIMDNRSRQDAYYRARYRVGDTNVKHRLRAWRSYGEVLFPRQLRQEMKKEVAIEFSFYHDL